MTTAAQRKASENTTRIIWRQFWIIVTASAVSLNDLGTRLKNTIRMRVQRCGINDRVSDKGSF